ncbi:hypothetical protein Btru_060456 [Bulinus truncatus]|nr:hypothetical protein Btru_060456 [Bulinus truncatus]
MITPPTCFLHDYSHKSCNSCCIFCSAEGWSHCVSRTNSNGSSESKQNGEHVSDPLRPKVPLRHENRPNITIYDWPLRQGRTKLAEMEESKQQLNEPDRVTVLELEVKSLREELAKSREQINQLQEQEKILRERLADQVHNQFTMRSGQVFEDLNLGDQRPTSLISAYHDLYREGRVDTLDALDVMPELHGLDILKMKILFSVVVLSFRCVQQTILDLKSKLRLLLCLPEKDLDPVSADMEININNYLIKSIERYNLGPIVEEVKESIANTLYEFPGLKNCTRLKEFTEMTVRIAWGLSVQTPPYLIVYESRKFQSHQHTRFHTSISDLDDIKSFLWPSLIDGQSGECVSKGVVIT